MKNFMVCILTVVLLLLSEGIAMTDFQLKLIRADQAVADIPIVTEMDMLSDPIFRRRTLDNVDNDIKIQYIRRICAIPSFVISIDSRYVLAWITSDGNLYTAGNNYYGRTGRCSEYTDVWDECSPGVIPRVDNALWTQVFLGQAHGMALNANGDIYAWGQNESCQLGLGDGYSCGDSADFQPTPTIVFGGHNWSQLPGDGWPSTNSGAIDENGDVYMWGSNYYGMIGNGSLEQGGVGGVKYNTPQKVNGGFKFVKMSIGHYHVLALTEDGTVYGWGHNYYGQCGSSGNYHGVFGTACLTVPTQIESSQKFTDICAGRYNSIGIGVDGKAYAWGEGGWGACGVGDSWVGGQTDYYTPQKCIVIDSKTIVDISAGNEHMRVVTSEGEVYGWGRNANGELNKDPCIDWEVPTPTLLVNESTGVQGKFFVRAGGFPEFTIAVDNNNNIFRFPERGYAGCDNGGSRAWQQIEGFYPYDDGTFYCLYDFICRSLHDDP